MLPAAFRAGAAPPTAAAPSCWSKREDGKLQVTYGRHPLYFFALDKKPGDLKGQGYASFGGTWWAVSATGKKITAKL